MKSTTSVKSASSPKKISKITSNSVRPSRICINYRPLENSCWFPSPVVRKPSPEAKKGQNPITSPSPVHHQSWKPHHHTYHHQWRLSQALLLRTTMLRLSSVECRWARSPRQTTRSGTLRGSAPRSGRVRCPRLHPRERSGSGRDLTRAETGAL